MPALRLRRWLLSLLLWTLPLVGQAQFIFTTNNLRLTITGYTGPGGAVVIPGVHNGLLVTRIGDSAFASQSSLTNVTIPNSVTSIGSYAFAQCRSLTNVMIGNSVTNIGDHAFDSCTRLATVTIPDSVTNIGRYAFADCSTLVTVTIGTGVTSIGESAFYFCDWLVSVTIPSSVTSIGDDAFAFCNLWAIYVDALNPAYSSVNGSLLDKGKTLLIQCPGGKGGSYTIPDSVTDIGSDAFMSAGLTNVIIPNSVTNIGFAAFGNCASLTSVTIPNSVTTIGDFAFNFCTGLTRVTIGSGVTSIGGGAFSCCSWLMGVYFQGDAPTVGGVPGFEFADTATVYYLPGTTGWGPTFAGRPAVLWNPQVQTGHASFGVRTNRFGFTITGTANIPLVVEANDNLANPSWVALQNLNLTNGAFYFSDPGWTNHPARTYRLRAP